ncbi:MAG: GNAT family N-acetyltransferase [Candidatus Bathyarchaeota archaeon]|jgi:ribosomal protein S18 acetylase RimI-like enzyme
MLEVRIATVGDFDELLKCYVEIWDSLRKWLPSSFVDRELESIQETERVERFKKRVESKDAIFLLAEEGNEIVGVALGTESAGVGTLGFLGVKMGRRRKGVGANLLHRFVEEAKRRKAHKVWLFTSPNLKSAINLYVKNSFIPEGFLRRHTHGLDMIIYSKFLA